MVQVENEYGSYGNDREYIGTVRDDLKDAGFDVPYVVNDEVRAVAVQTDGKILIGGRFGGVAGVPRSRVGAKRVAEHCTDLTPPAEYEKLRERHVQQLLAREKGSGRPTKRDRRLLDQLFE